MEPALDPQPPYSDNKWIFLENIMKLLAWQNSFLLQWTLLSLHNCTHRISSCILTTRPYAQDIRLRTLPNHFLVFWLKSSMRPAWSQDIFQVQSSHKHIVPIRPRPGESFRSHRPISINLSELRTRAIHFLLIKCTSWRVTVLPCKTR